MKAEKFDFRRLCDEYDPALVGKRVIFGNTLDDLFYVIEDCSYKGEVLTKVCDEDAPFWSEESGEHFWLAYVLDEDFVNEPEEPLAEVRWFREDVHNSLARIAGRDIADDDVDAVIDGIDWKALESAMIERGWDFIDIEADEYLRRLK